MIRAFNIKTTKTNRINYLIKWSLVINITPFTVLQANTEFGYGQLKSGSYIWRELLTADSNLVHLQLVFYIKKAISKFEKTKKEDVGKSIFHVTIYSITLFFCFSAVSFHHFFQFLKLPFFVLVNVLSSCFMFDKHLPIRSLLFYLQIM